MKPSPIALWVRRGTTLETTITITEDGAPWQPAGLKVES